MVLHWSWGQAEKITKHPVPLLLELQIRFLVPRQATQELAPVKIWALVVVSVRMRRISRVYLGAIINDKNVSKYKKD